MKQRNAGPKFISSQAADRATVVSGPIAQACAFRPPCSRSMHYERAPCFRSLKQMVWRGSNGDFMPTGQRGLCSVTCRITKPCFVRSTSDTSPGCK